MSKLQTYFLFLIISLLVLFLNAFPNYYAFLKTPPGMSFSGQASWFDPWDINVYTAAIKWGQGGHLLLQNTYTTTPHTAVLMYPLYTVSGFLLPQVSPYLLFHLLATILGFRLLMVIWKLSQEFSLGGKGSLLALFLIALGGGVGGADLSMTGFTFLSHWQRGHEALGMTFYLLSLVLFFVGTEKGHKNTYLSSFIFLVLLIFFYPYYFLSFVLICGTYGMYLYFREGITQPLKFLLIGVLCVLPILITYYQHLQSTSGFSGVLSQQLATPDILQLFLGYGMTLPLFIFGLWKGPKNNGIIFLSLWFFLSFLLALIPLGFTRFYLRGLFFPLIMVILLNIKQLAIAVRISPNIIVLLLIITLPISTLYMTFKRIDEVDKNNHWFYLTTEEREALNFLDQTVKNGEGVLAGYTLGNFIPANTYNRVYFGHLLQTPKSQEKINNLLRFYSQALTDNQAKTFLIENDIHYVFWGKEERAMTQISGNSQNLKYPFLKNVFSQGDVRVFSY